jgi:hypothetical protein
MGAVTRVYAVAMTKRYNIDSVQEWREDIDVFCFLGQILDTSEFEFVIILFLQ